MLWCCFLLNIPYHSLQLALPAQPFLYNSSWSSLSSIEPRGNSSCSPVLLHLFLQIQTTPDSGSKDSRHWVAWDPSLVKSFHFNTRTAFLITWLVTRNFDVTCHIRPSHIRPISLQHMEYFPTTTTTFKPPRTLIRRKVGHCASEYWPWKEYAPKTAPLFALL